MNYTQIKCFLSLAKTLNFTETANSMYLSQSTVSKNIKNLEKELGIKLFNRDYHQILLTDKGKIFYNQMRMSVSEIDDTIQSLRESKNIPRPKIKIGYTDLPFEKKWLPLALRLINAQTNLELVPYFIDPGREQNINQLIQNETIDFMMMQKDIISEKKEMAYIEIFQKGFSVVVTQEDYLFVKNCIDFTDLVGRNIYLWNGQDTYPAIESLKFSFANSDLDINYKEEVNSSILLTYIRAKMGIGIVPSVLYDKNATDLRYIPLKTNQLLSYGILYLAKSSKKEEIILLSRYILQAIKLSVAQW